MVCIHIPRFHGNADEDAHDTPPPPPAKAEAGQTVLVVDDEPGVCMLVTEVLDQLGYNALEAHDGPSALRLVQSNVCIDMLVTDVGLSGGLNGRQVADASRTVRPSLKVLFITGYAENAVVGNGLLSPAMAVMTKSFSVDVLANRIKALLEESG